MIYEGSKDNEYIVHFNVTPDILISKLIENVYLKSNLIKNSSKAECTSWINIIKFVKNQISNINFTKNTL